MNRRGAAAIGGTRAVGIRLPGPPHIPGRTPRPPEAAFAPFKAALGADLTPDDLAKSSAFSAAFDLFARRYYWEAHEMFEAVWIRLPPAGAERVLLRGLIQLANAGLKARMGRRAAAERILGLADAALAEAARRLPGVGMGLTARGIAALRRQAVGEEARE